MILFLFFVIVLPVIMVNLRINWTFSESTSECACGILRVRLETAPTKGGVNVCLFFRFTVIEKFTKCLLTGWFCEERNDY